MIPFAVHYFYKKPRSLTIYFKIVRLNLSLLYTVSKKPPQIIGLQGEMVENKYIKQCITKKNKFGHIILSRQIHIRLFENEYSKVHFRVLSDLLELIR